MKTKYLFIAGLALIMAAACNKNAQVAEKTDGMSSQEIVIAAEGEFGAEVTTKASEITLAELASLKVSAMTSTAYVGSFENVTFTKGGDGKFKGEKYWPETDGGWSFVASNTTIEGTYAAPYISAANAGTDYLWGYATPSHKATTIDMTINHAFAQVGTVTMRAPAGFTVTGCSVTIAPITAGRCAVKDGTWSNLGAAGTPVYIFGGNATGVAVSSAAGGTTSDDNDLWLVPGTYTLTANYTITKGDFTKAYTKTATVALVQGKNNNIGLNGAGDPNIPDPGSDVKEINFTVTVTPWADLNVPADFS